jgi:hypothetical protein
MRSVEEWTADIARIVDAELREQLLDVSHAMHAEVTATGSRLGWIGAPWL